mmetsp:Transcript_17039/g.33309  ORF Transcript_17039/g.33309 Transcript_17039/m.33309 type:complete len:755 (-) Transcript_17039:58-2322(-)
MELSVAGLTAVRLAFTNCAYVSPEDYAAMGMTAGAEYVDLQGHAYTLKSAPDVQRGTLGLSNMQRNFLRVEQDQPVRVLPLRLPRDETLYLDSVDVGVSLLRRSTSEVSIDCRELSAELAQSFHGQVWECGMNLAFKFHGENVRLVVNSITHVPQVSGQAQSEVGSGENRVVGRLKSGAGGVLTKSSAMTFSKIGDTPVRLTGQATRKSASKMMDTNFEKLGIGGLNKEFGDIFRRAFVSRILPPEVVHKLGIKHVRGLMLFGPPGCGKTLIARQISKVLQGGENAREPKIVSGPEVLSKFVGQAEENVRKLFAEAEAEQAAAGDDSELHVIIFDEIDAICRQRGTKRDGTGVGDSVVNQLLAKIDGVNSLNNVLLIGMTNRLDMIDNALLRPGRFEVQMEIGLPSEEGRLQILNIHTKSMRETDALATDVNLVELAKDTKNFSGAEIEGLVRSAVSFATNRHVNTDDLSKLLDADQIQITGDDFAAALEEVHPAFGVQGEDELKSLYRNGIIPFSDAFQHVNDTLRALSDQCLHSPRTPLLSVLLSGEKGCGKTALVAKMAAEAGFNFTKVVTADSMIGYSENQKCSQIAAIFEDAYKSPISLIVFDDIERLIDYVPIGPRFSNLVLQALLVLINKPPPREDRKLMVIGTTSVPHLLQDLGLVQVFNVELSMPLLDTNEAVEEVIRYLIDQSQGDQGDSVRISSHELSAIAQDCKKPIAVKKLLVVLEMARQGTEEITVARFQECLMSIGYSS